MIIRGNSIPAKRNLEIFAHIVRKLSNTNDFCEIFARFRYQKHW